MRKAYLEKQSKRLKQRAMLLTENPSFQETVTQIREVFKIPPDGIKSSEESEIWHRDFYQSDDKYYKEKWLPKRKEIIKLKNEKKFKESQELTKQINNSSPINSLKINIKEILRDFKIPATWQDSIKRYILFNDLDNMNLPLNVSVKIIQDEDVNLRRMYIEVDDSTRQKDIEENWDLIDSHQKRLHSRTFDKFQPLDLEVFERDKEAYTLQKGGKKLREIAETLSKKYGGALEYHDISKFIERHREKVGIN